MRLLNDVEEKYVSIKSHILTKSYKCHTNMVICSTLLLVHVIYIWYWDKLVAKVKLVTIPMYHPAQWEWSFITDMFLLY